MKSIFNTSILMKKRLSLLLVSAAALLGATCPADACTGITLKSQDGHTIVARTIEWGGSDLNSQYVIVPRGYRQQSLLPGGGTDGMTFTALDTGDGEPVVIFRAKPVEG